MSLSMNRRAFARLSNLAMVFGVTRAATGCPVAQTSSGPVRELWATI